MAMFNSYVKLPEGTEKKKTGQKRNCEPQFMAGIYGCSSHYWSSGFDPSPYRNIEVLPLGTEILVLMASKNNETQRNTILIVPPRKNSAMACCHPGQKNGGLDLH